MSNRLVELMNMGQSIWFDNLTRAMLDHGELARLIEADDLRGMTSNPTIFEKSITGSTDYDAQLRQLASAGETVQDIYESLILTDIARAAETLWPVYERTGGLDGYISLEVSPRLAYDTAGTIAEAERLFNRLGRRNVMIKIPASPEGIPAIEESIYRGLNINITMIFSIENYEQVAEAYIRGLERRAAAGQTINNIASVASFFVSRVDTMIDHELQQRAQQTGSPEEKEKLTALAGKAGVANARLAYQRFKEIFHGERFAVLKAQGAQVQRPLWASTGTKNPQYSDVLYVDHLIGPETVNTVPPATYKAFLDHGQVALTIEENLDEARQVIKQLADVGIDLRVVTEKLQTEGLNAFVTSFDTLNSSIKAKRSALISGINDRLTASLGSDDEKVQAALQEAARGKVLERIWRKDASVWKEEASQQKMIGNSLGWLTVSQTMLGKIDELNSFAEEVRASGEFRHLLLCGMGGSSLAPEVLRQTFGQQDDYPELLVLDSTDPDTLHRFAETIDVGKTLFIIASKSGTTTEPLAFYKFWFEQAAQRRANPGDCFIAITDPDTLMEQMATEARFKKIFLNPADIGGRYSALSYFGLVPAALMGLDVRQLLERAERLADTCQPVMPLAENPGARLGAIIAECARGGRDKLTIIADAKLASLGLWIEQLIAESTGKEGQGVVPVAGEPVGAPAVYGPDRLFVSIALERLDRETEVQLKTLEAAGHPVLYRTLTDLYDLGEEFFLWEIATAFAGARLGINPFDQPNVQESKDATKELLEAFKREGKLQEPLMLASDGMLTVYAEPGQTSASSTVTDVLHRHLAQASEGDYIALLNYLEETPEHDEIIQAMRTHLRDETRCATTTGYGPRFLHSTGQLHKGGSNAGLFIQITAPDTVDYPVPGEPYTFSTLKDAQAQGDLRALVSHGRRAIRIDLGVHVAPGLQRLQHLIADALSRSGSMKVTASSTSTGD